MTEWIIKKNEYWHIYADGKEVDMCDTEEKALEILRSIISNEGKK